jgi:hypothetical protein
MSALQDQIGGDHYKNMAIQPIEFSMRNGYDACIHSAIKYVSRHRSKGGLEDIKKARHFIKLRHELLLSGGAGWATPSQEIAPEVYAAENGLEVIESVVIFLIHAWAFQSSEDDPRTALSEMIDELLEELATDVYYTPRMKSDV